MKRHLIRKILAIGTLVLMCSTLVPVSVFAGENDSRSTENVYQITSDSDIVVSAIDDETQLSAIKEETLAHNYGVTTNDDPISVQFYKYGKLLSPFEIALSDNEKTDKNIVTFTMAEPDTSQDQFVSTFITKTVYKLAVQEKDSTDVLFYPVEQPEDGTLSMTIPVSSHGAYCALVQLNTWGWQSTVSEEPTQTVELTSPLLEDTNGTEVNYSWSYTMSGREAELLTKHHLTAFLRIEVPTQIELTAEDITLDSEYFKLQGTPVEGPDGIWTVELVTKVENTSGTGDIFEVEELQTPLKVQVKGTIPYEQFSIDQDVFVNVEVDFFAWQASDHKGLIDCVTVTAPLEGAAVGKTKAAVTITPADLTIYEGGDGGYDAIYDGENSDTPVSSDSLPHPLFKITAPKGSDIDPANLTFTVGNKSWTVVPDGENTGLYHFSEGEGQDKVRVQYTNNATGEVVTSDEFDPNAEGIKDTFNTYTIDLYAGENDLSEVCAGVADSGTDYPISVNSGTLTVRAVEADDPTSDVVVGAEGADLIPAEEQVPAANEAVALVPAGTTYTLNGLEGVTLPEVGENGSKPSLLFDDIIKSDGVDRIGPLEDATDSALNGAAGDNVTRNYQMKYLDLVDANNGNAWIKASDNVTIYWGYPEGTDKNTEFKIVHFKDLHRDNSNGNTTGFDPDDINADNVEVFSSDATDEALKLETTDQGIKFEVTPGNFSPYVLVWDVDNTPDPGPGPDPDTPVGPVHPVDPTPELERGDHYAYIVGYEDDTIRPQNNITRAEVATIFFRLLTDESREAYFTTDCDFTDVNGSAWYANTVATLSNAGILAGYPDGSFRPNDPITRAEFAAIATRFDDLAAADSTFTDIDGHWAEDAINAAYGAGWVGGYPDGTFRPNNNITRAEVMSLVNRVLDREVDEDGMLDDMLTWVDNEPGTWYYEAVQEATNSHDYEREDADSVETWTQINEPIDWDAVEEELVNSH